MNQHIDPIHEDVSHLEGVQFQGDKKPTVSAGTAIPNLGALMKIAPEMVRAMEQSMVFQFCMSEMRKNREAISRRKREYRS